MPNYEDSESESDTSLYQTTKVLLGYASKEATDDTISIIGGQPTWLDSASPPSAALARCSVCHDLMAQLLQLHADLPEEFTLHERRLHVFACRRRACARKPGSVRALRTSRAASVASTGAPAAAAAVPSQTKAEPPRDIGGSIFGSGGKLFGAPPPPTSSTSTDQGSSGLPATFASKARISPASPSSTVSHAPTAPVEPWPAASSLPQPYTESYLDAGYEELDPDFGSAPVPNSNSIAIETSSSAEDSGGGGDADSALAESNLDRTFQRFADRLAQNPEQVLRYEFRGTPLLYSKTDAVGKLFSHVHDGQPSKVSVATSTAAAGAIPSCPRCGAHRAFEVQLLPHAIMELEAEDESSAASAGRAVGKGAAAAAALSALEGMEWATVLVGVCGQDCAGLPGESAHVEEWVGVQWEEQRR